MQITEQQTETISIEGTTDVADDFKISEDAVNQEERLREELASERDLRLRLAAEFDNYRRRVRREQGENARAGKQELLEQLISMADDLDLAMANLDGVSDSIAEVVRMTHRRLMGLLEANGVAGFSSLGQRFDPERHEAFDIAKNTITESGNVHAELRRGYFWGDKLLRAALVVVAQ